MSEPRVVAGEYNAETKTFLGNFPKESVAELESGRDVVLVTCNVRVMYAEEDGNMVIDEHDYAVTMDPLVYLRAFIHLGAIFGTDEEIEESFDDGFDGEAQSAPEG